MDEPDDAITIAINGERLNGRIADFARIGALSAGGVNRQALTQGDRDARRLLAGLAKARGFGVFQDPVANLFIRREGSDAALPPLLIGSHLDSQPSGGRFDGALGTLSAFEVLESLEDARIGTRRSVEVVAWTNEEGCRFTPGCMGSMAFAAGAIPPDWSGKASTDGAIFDAELAATLASLPEVRMRPLGFPVSAYLEVHIEQGPSLEAEGIPIGAVTGIQGTRWLEVTVGGQTAHAGTTELSYRRDPLKALVHALDTLYATLMPSDPDARFTVGRISVTPGSINAIPDSASCTIDIRHPGVERLSEMEVAVMKTVEASAGAQGCVAEVTPIFDMSAGRFDEAIIDVIEDVAARMDLSSKRMISGAFHDALFVSRVAPSAMIFVPCRDGLSHNEAEFVEPAHAAAGCAVLAAATVALAGRA